MLYYIRVHSPTADERKAAALQRVVGLAVVALEVVLPR